MDDPSTIVPMQLENSSIIRVQATQIGPVLETPPVAGDEIESDVSLNLRPLKEVADVSKGLLRPFKGDR